MPTLFQDSLERLNARMVELLWRQWCGVGVAGYGAEADGAMVDPEALVLATTRYGRYDSRLMDEALDWLVQFGQRLSVQRLQGLARNWPGVGDARVLGAIAEVLGQQVVHRKWRVIAERGGQAAVAEPLFVGSSIPDRLDAQFAKHGLLREPLELRAMSQAPDPRNPQNLIFALRALLGVNARAEIIAWLLTHPSGHPAAIARSTGYFSKSVQQILNEMADSGHIGAIRVGREKFFSIPRLDRWQALLLPATNPPPRWVEWMPLFAALTRFATTLSTPGIDGQSAGFQAIQLREALVAATPALARAGRAHDLHASPDMRGQALINAVLADLDSLLAPVMGQN